MSLLFPRALALIAWMHGSLVSAQETPPVPTATEAAMSIVAVEHWKDQRRQSITSGFFVAAPDAQQHWILGYLAEAEANTTYQIALGRTMVEGILLAHDASLHLALFKLNPTSRKLPLTIADHSLRAEQAGALIALMNADSSPGTPTTLGRFACKEPLAPLTSTHLRLHIAAATTNAGAPVFDESLHIVGMLGSQVPNTLDCFHAIPAEQLNKFLRDIRTHGKPTQPWLGIAVTKTSPAPIITGCRESSPALAAGLEAGDLVLSLGPARITTLQDLIDATELLSINQEVEMKILRGQQIKLLKITPRLKPEIAI